MSNTEEYSEKELKINLKLYTIDVIKKVCYRFSDRFFFNLNINDDKINTVSVLFKFPIQEVNIRQEEIIREFNQELIDQSLREAIFKETETTRNLILANAFANSKLSED